MPTTTQQFQPGDPVKYTGHKKRTGPGHGAVGEVVEQEWARDTYQVRFYDDVCPCCHQPKIHTIHPNYLERD